MDNVQRAKPLARGILPQSRCAAIRKRKGAEILEYEAGELLAKTISQGHANAYPIYRLEWQTAGSLQRRFRSCLSGLRAEMLPYSAPQYVDLELYPAWRANGLPIETPGVRR